MSTNLSKEKKQQLIKKIDAIRTYLLENGANSDLEGFLGEIEVEIRSQKYGLIFEEHLEKIDKELMKCIPVFSEDKKFNVENEYEPNFLIEGDNLPALELLKKTHKGNIDYIYIDPPYNTKSKDFRYDDTFVDPNDDFKHSKWLSFMEKRLIIAHRLLKTQGCIMISINEEEVFGLKMLCDKIFGIKNYLAMFSVKVRHEDRILKGDKDFHEVMEYMLMYRKSPNFITVKRQVDNTSNKDYIYQINEKSEPSEIINLDGKEVCVFKPDEYEIIKQEQSADNLKKINIRGSIKEGNSSGRFFMKHFEALIGDKKGYLYKVPDMGDDKFGYRYFLIPDNDKRKNGDYFQGVPVNRNDIKEVPYPNYIETNTTEFVEINSVDDELRYLDVESAFNNVGYEGNVEFRNGKKPLAFLDKCFELAGVKRNKNAIVLDFFAGSGSTGHALMNLNKLDEGNRKFILVTNNQNNICQGVTYKRLKYAIENDNLRESLRYYKIELISTENKVYYEYSDELLKHIKELVQLENNICIEENSDYIIVLTDEEMDKILEEDIKCIRIYVGVDVLLSEDKVNKLNNKGIDIVRIPNYYYSNIM